MNEAGDDRARGRARRRAVVTSCLGLTVAIGFARFSVGLYLPHMADDLGIGRDRAAVLVTSNLAAYLVATVVTPALTARVGLLAVLRLGIAAATAAMAMLAIADRPLVAHLAMVLAGVGGAFVWIAAAVIASDASDGGGRGRLLGWIGTFNGVGILTSSLLALALVEGDTVRWRTAWAIQAAIGVGVLAISATIPAGADRRARGRAPRVPVARSEVVALACAYSAFAIGYTVFVTHLVGTVGATSGVRDGPIVWLAVGLGALPGPMLLGAISDRAGRAPTLAAGQFAGAASALLIVVYVRTGIPVWPLAGVLFGVLLTGMATLIPAVVADRFAPAQTPRVLTILTLSLGIAQAATPAATAVILGAAAETALYVLAAVAFGAAGVLFLVRRPAAAGRPQL